MTAHIRTASQAPGFTPATITHTSTRRLVVIAGFLLEAVIVLGLVASSVGLGAAPYPDPDHGWTPQAPSVVPAAPVIEAIPAPDLEPAPAPAPAPAP